MNELYAELKSCSRSMRVLLFSWALLLASIPGAFAQNFQVSGTVKDASGQPIIGANVIIKGTTAGTTTLVNGQYELGCPSKKSVLVFSYLGMTSQEIEIAGRTKIDVVLKQDSGMLDEVVVVGYGTQKKAHMTGAVVAVSDAEIKKATVANVSQALVGKLPGIVSQQSAGAPGADDVTMLVRGHSSYKGSSPLCLVDGVERPLGQVDPNDVASVSVLKDAASCAVYGMKAANGVILITTKQGKKGTAEINYRGSVTLSHITTFPKFMNGTQYMTYYNMARELDGNSPFFSQRDLELVSNGDPWDGLENTDWSSPLYRTTVMHQHNLSVNGGSDKVTYFVSGGYMTQEGILRGHDNERGNFRSNVMLNPTKNLKVSLNVAGRIRDLVEPGCHHYQNAKGWNNVHLMTHTLPFVPKQIEKDGKIYETSAYRGNPGQAGNAEADAKYSGSTKTRNINLQTAFNVEYATPFLKGLKLAMFGSWDWGYASSKKFVHGYDLMAYNNAKNSEENPLDRYEIHAPIGAPMEGNMYESRTDNQQLVLRPSIAYNNTFDRHTVGVMFLYEQTQINSSLLTGSRRNFVLIDLPFLNFGKDNIDNSGSAGKSAYAGFVGRLNYAYDNKYLVEASFRYDGSYLFHKDHRWGFFPSVSVGWVVSQEDFFQNWLPKVEYFKLRASIGEIGSDNVGPFLYRKTFLYENQHVAFGQIPSAHSVLINKTSYPMEKLTWERCRTMDIGFEFSAWNGKLGVEFDYFYKYTYDILQSSGGVYAPSLGGHTPAMENTGAFDNRGFELTLKHHNKIGSFQYGITGNLTYAHNRILRMTQADNTLPWQNRLGSSVGDIWGYKTDGLFQTQEQIDNAPQLVGQGTPRLGDIRYVDINGDGKVDVNDQVKIARGRLPEMMFSLTLDAAWKGLDLSVQLQGAALTDRMLSRTVSDGNALTQPWYAGVDNAPIYLVEGSWRPDNTNAEFPRLSLDSKRQRNFYVSDFWKRNGAYLRLKNVTLGYTLPKKWTNKIGIGNLRVYFSGQNLCTATEFAYIDPESGNSIDGYYPQQRTLSFGVDLTF